MSYIDIDTLQEVLTALCSARMVVALSPRFYEMLTFVRVSESCGRKIVNWLSRKDQDRILQNSERLPRKELSDFSQL
jgi:hypothetical protein